MTALSDLVGDAPFIVLNPDEVPERWRDRARTVCIIRLLPDESATVLGEGAAIPELDREEEKTARLVARGLSIDAIGAELSLSPRSVRRRLGQLYDHFGVRTKAELARLLAGRGF